MSLHSRVRRRRALMRLSDAQQAQPAAVLAQQEPPRPERAALAPWPVVDRYQTVIGAGLSMQYVSSCLRMASTGWRREFVDLLDEQLEREPHGFAVLSQRILAVAGARLEIVAAELDGDDPREERAEEIARFVNRCIKSLPDLQQALAGLLWALYYGVSAAEISWDIRPTGETVPTRLHFIHSRRLLYPDPGSWSVHIWDQGAVRTFWDFGNAPTNQGNFGLRPEDYPGKFIVHTPPVRGTYPTRDGLGRELTWWFIMKGMAARTAGQYVERFAKPWPVAYYNTKANGNTNPRLADTDDIAAADAATRALGIGSAAAATLPDSIKLELFGPGVGGSTATLAPVDFIEFLNGEISKAVLGQTLTTESGKRGNVGATEVHKQGALELSRYDAGCLADTLRRDLISWIVRYNYPEDMDLTPDVRIHPEEKPDPKSVIEVAAKAAAIGMPLDADALADQLGLRNIPQEKPEDAEPGWKPKPRRLSPVKPVDLSALDESIKPPPTPTPPLNALAGAPLATPVDKTGSEETPSEDDADDSAATPNKDIT